jgi:hypothetical protein
MDLKARLWTIPAARMKGGKTHIVPLSEPCPRWLRRRARTMISVKAND